MNKIAVSNGSNGEIISIRCGDKEYALAASQAFSLQLLDRQGEARLLESSGFTRDGSTWSCHPACPGLRVDMQVRSNGGEIRFRPQVSGVPSDMVLEWFDGPQIKFDQKFKLFHPRHDGVVIHDYSRPKNYHPIAFAKRGVAYGTAFPGRAQIQCMGVFDENGEGFYFGAHDAGGCTKAVEYEVLADGGVRLSLQCFSGCSYGEAWMPEFDFILAPLTNGWRGACRIYRDFLENIHGRRKGDFPEFMKNSPVILIYPVRGRGRDTGDMSPNCYFPYTNALPVVDKFAGELDSQLMALLMHWEGTAPWAPPYVWPPYGGEAALAEFRDRLHEKGHLLGVYCSGVAWTCRSRITGYAPGCTAEQEKFMLRGPKGELEATICNSVNGQRLGYDMCMAQPEARQIAMDEILKMAEFGIDYSQFFDQNHGGAMHNCYAGDHCHPPVPGAWQTRAMRSFMGETLSRIKAMGKEMILGCESAAAEPFAEFLALNDSRASFMQSTGETVPAQQFVFHGLSCNFSGNQCGAGNMDFNAHPEDLCRRIAYGFNAGDLLSITLKEDGNIHWAWAYSWDNPGPEQQHIITLIRNLNAIRRRYPEFFLYGRMAMPKDEITEQMTVKKMVTGRELLIPGFYHNCWEDEQGRQITVICNYLPEPLEVTVNGKILTLPPLDAVIL